MLIQISRAQIFDFMFLDRRMSEDPHVCYQLLHTAHQSVRGMMKNSRRLTLILTVCKQIIVRNDFRQQERSNKIPAVKSAHDKKSLADVMPGGEFDLRTCSA